MTAITPVQAITIVAKMAPAEQDVMRFFTQLFLCPRYIALVSEHWLRKCRPLPIHTGAPEPLRPTPSGWAAALLIRVLQNTIDDVTVLCQASMSAVGAMSSFYWTFVLNVVSPACDMTMGLTRDLFSSGHAKGLQMGISQLFADPLDYWQSCCTGDLVGSIQMAYFQHTATVRQLYRPVLFFLELMTRLCDGLIAVCHNGPPPDFGFFRETVEACRSAIRDMAHMPSDDRQLLDLYFNSLRRPMREENITECARITRTHRDTVMHTLALPSFKAWAMALNLDVDATVVLGSDISDQSFY